MIELHDFARFLEHDAFIEKTIYHIRNDNKICAAQVLLLAARFDDDIRLLRAAFYKLEYNKSTTTRDTNDCDRIRSFTRALPTRYLATIAEWACLLPASPTHKLPGAYAMEDIELFASDLRRHAEPAESNESEWHCRYGQADCRADKHRRQVQQETQARVTTKPCLQVQDCVFQ